MGMGAVMAPIRFALGLFCFGDGYFFTVTV